MKFNSKTLQILRNFSSIEQSMTFVPGDVLRTISRSKTVMAMAKIDTEIEQSFAIYDMSQFLSAVSLFTDPEIDLGDSALTIRQGNEQLTYRYCDPSLIVAPPQKDIKIPDPEVSFSLKQDALAKVQKALSVIGAPEIAVIGDREKIYLTAFTSSDPSGSSFKVEVGETDKKFQMVFLADNIKVLPGDYEVEISSKGISKFEGDDVTYWIAVETKPSKFED